jgi:diguanylate cyclase (GGDEF)-like protein
VRLTYFFLQLILILATTFLLGIVWEFGLEEVVVVQWLRLQGPESISERWEYIVSILLFVSLAMIYPAIVGVQLIRRDQQLIEEVQRLAQQDSLTGLANRRKLIEVAAAEIRRCQRYGGTFSVILLDIDRFKEVNDRWGHAMGDRVLKETGDLLRKTIRNLDSAGRWGGEEFLVVCPQTDLEGAAALAEKLRAAYAAWVFPAEIRRTASFGVAAFRDEGVDELVGRADDALYAAKEAGRDRVALADSAPR